MRQNRPNRPTDRDHLDCINAAIIDIAELERLERLSQQRRAQAASYDPAAPDLTRRAIVLAALALALAVTLWLADPKAEYSGYGIDEQASPIVTSCVSGEVF